MFKCRCLTQLCCQNTILDTQEIWSGFPSLVGWCILRCSPILASALGIHLSFLPCTDGQLQCLSRQTDKLHLLPVHSYTLSTLWVRKRQRACSSRILSKFLWSLLECLCLCFSICQRWNVCASIIRHCLPCLNLITAEKSFPCQFFKTE